jgi:RecB family endonuclease NucS
MASVSWEWPETEGAAGEFSEDAGVEAGIVVVIAGACRVEEWAGKGTQVGGDAPRVLLQRHGVGRSFHWPGLASWNSSSPDKA